MSLVKINGNWYGNRFKIVPCHTGGWLLIDGDGRWVNQGPLHEMKRAARKLYGDRK